MKTGPVALSVNSNARQVRLRMRRMCLVAGFAAAIGVVPVYGDRVESATTAARGSDGPSGSFPVPIVINQSLDLSGGDGANGLDGVHWPIPFSTGWFSTAQYGGDGGHAGSLTLEAGGTIALSGNQLIDLRGGQGGQGGTSLPGTFVGPTFHLDDGMAGNGGGLYLNGPTTISLAGNAGILSTSANSEDSSKLVATGLNANLSENSRIERFMEIRLSNASSVQVRDGAHLGSARLVLAGSQVRLSDHATAALEECSLSASAFTVQNDAEVTLQRFSTIGSQIDVQGGLVKIENPGADRYGHVSSYTSVFDAGSTLRLSGGSIQYAADHDPFDRPFHVFRFQASRFVQTGGSFEAGEQARVEAVSNSTIDLLGGSVSLSRVSEGPWDAGPHVALQLFDSTLNIGSGNQGPSITVRGPVNTPAIYLERSTLNYNAGTLDLQRAIKMDVDSVFNVNAAAFDAGYLSGSIDRSAGTVNVTDSVFTLGTGNALGRLLGGATTTIGANFALTGTTFVISPTNLKVEDGGRVTSVNVVGISTSALSFGSGFDVRTSAGTLVGINDGVVTAARDANSAAAPILQGNINLAQGTLRFAPTEAGASARESIRFTGGATNGTIQVTASTNASVLFKDLSGDSILNTGASSSGIVARVDNALFGGVDGAGRMLVAGPLTIATVGTHTYAAALSGNGPITIGGGGEQQFLLSSTFTGGATLRSGVLAIGQGALGSSLISFDGGQLKALDALTIVNQLRLENGGGSINLNGHISTVTLPIVKVPSENDGGLTITGNGQLNLAPGANYTGGTVIRDGALVRVPSGTALGTGPVTIDGATLRASANITSQNTLRLGSNGATLDTGGSGNAITWNHDIANAPGVTDSSLFIQGGGTVTLNGAKSYYAITAVDTTTVSFNTGAAFGSGPIIANAATLRSTGLFSLATVPLYISSGGVHIELNNSLLSWNNQISPFFGGNGGLTLSGAGGMILLQPNTYNGQTTINSGTLAAFNTSGSATGSGPILVNGGILSGMGIYGLPAVQSNVRLLAGAIAPGDGPQTLTFANGGLMQLDGGEVVMELGTTSDLIAFASLADRLRGTGSTLRLIAGDGFSYANTYPIFSNVLNAGSQFSFASIISVNPALTPQFSYDATSRSYVVSFIPAPTTLGVLLGGGLFAGRRRRR